MTQATSTILGEIKLAGDLAGSADANAPELITSGVTPGQYVVPTITVDAKGRITAATSGTNSTLAAILPEATAGQKGIAKIGSNINLTTTQTVGSQTVNLGGNKTGASTTGLPTNAPNFSFTLTIDGTTIKSVTVTPGTVSTIDDVISVLTPKISPAIIELASGNLRIKSNTAGTCSTIRISNDNFFKFLTGYVAISAPIDGLGETTIYLDDASATVKGVGKFGSGFSVDGNGTANFDNTVVATATTGSRGVVQIGAGISVSNGLISTAAIPDADASTKGLVQIGQNISVSSGTISVPFATNSVAGVFKVGYGLKMTDGVLQLDTTALATSNTYGLVMIGDGLQVNNGVLSIASVGIASASTLGMVKIGAGIAVAGDGTISTDAASIADATYSVKGKVQIGSNIQVSNGVISLPIGNGTTPGIVKINTTVGLSVSNGVVSAVLANGTSTLGVVKIGDTNNLSCTAGTLDVGPNIAKKDSANTFTKAQAVALANPTFASTMSLDFSQSNSFSFTATSDFTLANPSNVVEGGVYSIIVKQDATGGRLITWGSNFKFRGFAPLLSTAPNAVDIITVIATASGFLATEVYKGY